MKYPRFIQAAIGLLLLFRSRLGLAASIAFLGVLLFRIHDEESLMHAEFGAEIVAAGNLAQMDKLEMNRCPS